LIYDYLIKSAQRLPDKVALVCDDGRYTYAQLQQCADSLGSILSERGVNAGDSVIVYSDNTLASVIAFWGVVKIGAVVSFVSPLVKVEKLRYLVTDCQARALVAENQHYDVISEVLSTCDGIRSVFLTDGEWCESDAYDLRIERLYGEIALNAGVCESASLSSGEEALAAIIYTSGSSGEPKGVMITHRNMLAAVHAITKYLEMKESDVVMNFLPMSFDYGLYQMIMAFSIGGCLVLERSFLYPARVLQLIDREGVTGVPCVPAIFSILIGMSRRREIAFPSVRYVTNTADVLPVKYLEDIKRIFPNAKIYSMYGLTECKRCSYLPPVDVDRKPESVGIAIPGTHLYVVDQSGKILEPGMVGEVVVQSDTVMKGYFGKPAETDKVLRAVEGISGKVLFTGDLGKFDDDGYLYLLGRMDNTLKVGGEKVAPKEVERVIANMEAVVEVYVYGEKDSVLGHIVKALVVAVDDSGLSAADILKECNDKLESFMVPKKIVFVDSLPRTASYKVASTEIN